MARPRVRRPIRIDTGVWFAIERQLAEDRNSFPNQWSRPVVRAVTPQVDDGRRPAKTSVGELVAVEADAFVDGHDAIVCDLRARHGSGTKWTSIPMQPLFDDRWRGMLPITEPGLYRFCVRARVDDFATWRTDLRARAEAGQDLTVELEVGAGLVVDAARRARAQDGRRLEALAEAIRSSRRGLEGSAPASLSDWLSDLSPDASRATVLFS